MGRYNFVGSIEGVAQQQLDFIGKVLEKRGYNGTDITIESLVKVGENMLSDVRRVVVNENGKLFKMVAKLGPSNPMMRQIGNTQMHFNNEAIMYSKVLPKFRQLQISADVPENEWFQFAECYGCQMDEPYEVILLEDLNESNYKMLDRFKPLSYECIKMALKNFAIFHSLSIVTQHQEPETYAEWAVKLRDSFVESEDDLMMNVYFEHIEESTIELLEDDRHKKILKGSISDMAGHILKLNKVVKRSKHSVIQQGDGWTNNVMFKMENEKPLSSILLDYQVTKPSNPAYDILYLLFTSIDYDGRKAHYYDFIDYYHEQFDKSLNNYGLKAAFLYPRDQLDADLKRYAKLALSLGLMISYHIVRKTEEAETFKDAMNDQNGGMSANMLNQMGIQDQDTMLAYKKRVEGLLNSFQELGLLKAL